MVGPRDHVRGGERCCLRGKPPKPDWVWWEPKPKQLLTQWRTTPKVVDWDRDGLPDLVMENWTGLFAPSKTPRPIVLRYREAISKVAAVVTSATP